MGGENERERYPLWLWPNLLSLDAPAVAVLWQALFARAAGVNMPVPVTVSLGLAVWVIYVADRLTDVAGAGEAQLSTARHRFYRRHWQGFAVAAVIATLGGGAVALFFLPEALAMRGFFMGALVLIYFAYIGVARGVARPMVRKEVIVGVLFALGTNLSTAFYTGNASAPLRLSDGSGHGPVARVVLEGLIGLGQAATVPALVFAAVCCLNCALISFSERAGMKEAGWGDFSFAASFLILIAGSLAMAVVKWGRADVAVYACVAGSGLGLWALERRAKDISPRAMRTLADGALLTPLFLIPFLGR